MRTVTVYSRRGCHLCEDLIEQIEPLLRGRAHLQVCDIDENPEWRQRYDILVPVVEVAGVEVCHYVLDREALTRHLDA